MALFNFGNTNTDKIEQDDTEMVQLGLTDSPLQYEPEYVEDLNGIPSLYYFNPDGSTVDLYSNVREIIAKEFTKSSIRIDSNLPNRNNSYYLLTLKPSTGIDEFKYDFALSMLKRGYVYYKVKYSKNGKLQGVYLSPSEKKGYKKHSAKHLKITINRDLINRYSEAIREISTPKFKNVLSIATNVNKSSVIRGTNTGDANTINTSPVRMRKEEIDKLQQDQYNNKRKGLKVRLRVAYEEIRKFGIFTTEKDETVTSHPGISEINTSILEEYDKLIQRDLRIPSSIIVGDYTEEQYDAFYRTHIEPISKSLEILINSEVVNKEDYVKGLQTVVQSDFKSTSSKKSILELINKGVYSGYLLPNEARAFIGLDNISYGDYLQTNANARLMSDLVEGNTEKYNNKTKRDAEKDGGKAKREVDEGEDELVQSLKEGEDDDFREWFNSKGYKLYEQYKNERQKD